ERVRQASSASERAWWQGQRCWGLAEAVRQEAEQAQWQQLLALAEAADGRERLQQTLRGLVEAGQRRLDCPHAARAKAMPDQARAAVAAAPAAGAKTRPGQASGKASPEQGRDAATASPAAGGKTGP